MSEKNNSTGMNELVDYQQKDYGKTMGAIMRFLWKCGGADAQILKYAPYADHIKAAGIGGVVLATTVMAMIAMGFAMHTIFGVPVASGEIDPITGNVVTRGQWFITIPVALVWGLIIFNLDRFIVSTVKGDGTEKITWDEWKAMFPRLFMAVLIGLTISAPLETYIFKREIAREWKESTTLLALKARFDKDNELLNNGDVARLKQQAHSDSVAYQQAQVEIAKVEAIQEVEGCSDCPCPSGRHQNTCNRLNKYQIQRDQSLRQYQLDTMQLSKIRNLRTARLDHVADSVKMLKPGFLDQLMMLERLSSRKKEINKFDPVTGQKIMKDGKEEMDEIYGSAFWPIWLVRLLFMIVEIAPVIFKFMIWDSSYDYMKDNVAQILEAKQGISLESFPDENNKAHKIRKNYNAERIVEVAKRQNELEKENAIHAITLYAEQERQDIEKNPERFVQGDDNEVPDSSPVKWGDSSTSSTENTADTTSTESTNDTDSSDEGKSTQQNNNSEDTNS